MPDVINILKDTPLPAILAVAGILFILLAVVRQLPIPNGTLELLPTQRMLAGIVGGLLLIVGVFIYALPSVAKSPVTDTRKATNSSHSVDTTTPEATPAASPTPIPTPTSALLTGSPVMIPGVKGAYALLHSFCDAIGNGNYIQAYNIMTETQRSLWQPQQELERWAKCTAPSSYDEIKLLSPIQAYYTSCRCMVRIHQYR